jgi:hypothetical protein
MEKINEFLETIKNAARAEVLSALGGDTYNRNEISIQEIIEHVEREKQVETRLDNLLDDLSKDGDESDEYEDQNFTDPKDAIKYLLRGIIDHKNTTLIVWINKIDKNPEEYCNEHEIITAGFEDGEDNQIIIEKTKFDYVFQQEYVASKFQDENEN